MNAITQLLNRARTVWAEQSLSRKVLFGMLALLVITIGVASTYAARTENFVPLYSNLSLEETGNITTKLKALGKTYKLDPSGTQISVPADYLAQIRVDMAAAGFQARGKGLEMFDEGQLAVPPDVQKINYVRALQGELARSIQAVDPIQSARVHLARPDPSPFVRDQKPVTASVIVTLKQGRLLSRTQSAAIVNLVARAIEGLKPENVSIIDSQGRQLSEVKTPESEGIPTAQMEYRQSLEAYLSQKAESMLAAHLGPGRAVVRVSTDIDFKRLRERTKLYQQPGVISAERTQEEKSTGITRAGGVSGAGSNTSRPAGVTTAGGGGTSSGQSNQTDYLVPFTEKESEDRLGGVSRITIAAMVDLSPGEGDSPRPLISVTDAQEVIKQAIGYKQGRDEIKVTDVRLGIPDTTPETPTTTSLVDRVTAIVAIVRNAALALTALIVLALLSILLLRKPKAPPELAVTAGTPASAQTAPVVPETEEKAEERRRSELDDFVEMAENDPEYVLELLLKLLEEEDEIPS